ncbi:glutathione S-transferase family protein [Vibrio cholerae]|uniref:glutathione S-transferase family protein n=1 Tax=Vibrio cholerae TaxID=666 RepID=UPI0011D7E29E|nr:glutathione S-transferase family protein [Vibrio cholerae]TXX76734.1 glutathione S-transferase family protein [Vibrio cholerae]GIA35326.1 glutathione S-transferase [Vibrio cholerae]
MKVYGDIQSGNCYKVKLLLSLLDIEYEWIHIDILKGETKTPEFLSMNPNGKIPVIVLESGQILCESNAILGYLADGTELIPSDSYVKAKVYEWLFFEQYSHEPFIAVARFIQKYQGMPELRLEEYRSLQPGGNKALSIMNIALEKTSYLVGNQLTIADVALYAYTHVAHEGGFDLSLYPNIQSWCRRIEEQKGYVEIA